VDNKNNNNVIAMPLLFLERFPWPSLQTYTALSVALLAGSIFSAYNTVTEQGFGGLETDDPQGPAAVPAVPSSSEVVVVVESDTDADNDIVGHTDLATTVLWYLVTDSLFVWVSLVCFGWLV